MKKDRGRAPATREQEMKKVRAVFFDAGGTLFRPFPSVGHVYAGLARKYGCSVSPDWVRGRFEEEWRRRNGLAHLKNTTEQGEKDWWFHLVGAVFRNRMPPAVFSRYFDELYDLFAQPRTWRLFPDSLPALKTLKKKGVRVGIVSNWDSRLFRLCEGLGVTQHVEFILASAVVGSVKPQPGIFRRALELAGVSPAEALHVGDSYREDFWGARRAGLRALLVCRNGRGTPDASRVHSLKEVCAIF